MNQRGYTLVELLVAAAVLGLMALVITVFYTNQLVNYARNDSLIFLQSNTKQAMEAMSGSVRQAQQVEDQNRNTDPNKSSGWSTTASSPATLVLAVPATDSSDNLLYYDSLHNTLVTNDVVFYYNSTEKAIYRRTIAAPVSGNSAVTTCPPASATPSCPADERVVADVASLSLAFLTNTGAVTATPSSASSVQLTLKQSRSVFGQTYTSSLSSQVTLRNN